MAEKSGVAQRNIFVRGLTAIALVALCLVGAALTFSTPANAWRGRGRGYYGGRGWGRGYYRGRGWGRGYGLYVAPPVYYGASRGCYWSRRWGRWICPY